MKLFWEEDNSCDPTQIRNHFR